jgi:hypothetical protein
LAWWSRDFAGGFCDLCAQIVVKCVVNRGEFVVKVWLETTLNQPTKNTPTFAYLFQSPATIGPRSSLHRHGSFGSRPVNLSVLAASTNDAAVRQLDWDDCVDDLAPMLHVAAFAS